MITIDCPICAATATVDETLEAVRCDACGLVASIAPDQRAPTLDLAA